jgi:diguanylate cyclase (GGDEF)-like protein/PAS domain S-box-containing protein
MSKIVRAVPTIAAAMPGGIELEPAVWEKRHRWILRLLWIQIIPVVVISVGAGYGVRHTFVEVFPIAMLAYLGTRSWVTRRTRSIVTGIGLMTVSAVLVHLSDGTTEMHFHFFVMLGVISLYQDWRPFLVSIAFVALHHGVVGALSPENVFDHQDAWTAPFKWAGIHAFFVLAMSAVCVASWRLIEDSNRLAREELEASERRFRALIENSSDVVTLVAADGTVLYDSPSASRVLGWDRDERMGRNGLEEVHPDDLERAIEILSRVVAEGGSTHMVEMRIRHRDGTYLWVEAAACNLLDDPAVGAIVANFRDITDRKALEEELSHQAFHDSLTALANRALLLDRIEHALESTRGRKGERLALIYLDLDDFKTVNDGLGHEAGDRILQVTAQRIASAIRPGDTASRLGGDEFAVLLEQIPDPSVAYEVGARVLEEVCTPIEVDGTLVSVAASLGIVVSDGKDDAPGLLRNADLAMYRAKGQGKGRFEIYEAGMHAAVVERMGMKADLRAAVERGEIEAHYQPIVDLVTGHTIGVEALARWNHPERGLVSPAEFIPLAEETGLIVPIGTSILRQACEATQRWRRDLGDRAPQTVSVNLSARQLQAKGLVDEVTTVLEVTELPATCLVLEITETVLLEETDDVGRTLRALKALGVRLALDDFGTGYSSLSHLDRFPVDIVKIDKSFIDSLNGSAAPPSPLVSAIVNLGGVLGLGVTAEGVEQIGQLDRLRDLGCQQAQGFLFAKPMPDHDLRSFLAGPVPVAPATLTAADRA